jgi:hypothetical protein
MRTITRRPPVLPAIIAALLLAGCGDEARERESVPEPPVEALRGAPLFPLSIEVTHTGTAEALEAEFHVAAAPDTVASWYRRTLLNGGWRIVGDIRAPDGAITIHAQRDGPPLWIIIRQREGGRGTEYRLIGALPDSQGQ